MRHILGTLLALACLAASLPSGAAEPAATITRLVGDAEVLRAGRRSHLAPGDEVRPRDRLITAAGGRLETRFGDGSVVVLAEGSEASVDIWVPGVGRGTLALRLHFGALLVDAGTIDTLRVRTPVAVVGVRGTKFWAGPVEGGRFGVLLLRGAIWVENRSGRVEVETEGAGVFLPPPDGPLPQELTEEAGAWAGLGAPRVPGGPPSLPTAWPEDLRQRALAGVEMP
ncbi:MAG: hypothetical protein EPN20_12060 [Magnetospirillum sp.]|nr:MAG: hypothetical protein EPN20_12060 [Magnetospirillum sp.]